MVSVSNVIAVLIDDDRFVSISIVIAILVDNNGLRAVAIPVTVDILDHPSVMPQVIVGLFMTDVLFSPPL